MSQASPPLLFETLATAPAGRRQRLLVIAICAIIGAASLALLPFAERPVPPMPGFVPAYQSALIMVYAMTTLLLLAQYRGSRALPLLVLGAGSLYVALTVLIQLLCFPNVFSPGLLLGQGPETLTWLWNFWHLGPPLFAVPYAIISRGGRQPLTPAAQVSRILWITLGAIVVAAGVTALLTVRYVRHLPANADADGGYWALTTSGVGPALILLTAVALGLLAWTTRLRSVLQLWMAASLFVLLMDNLITDLGAARGTVGWFVGRLEALLAGIMILGVYLRELDLLHRGAERTAQAREQARAEAQAARESLEIALDAAGMGEWRSDFSADTSYRTLRHDRIFGYQELQADWSHARFMQHVHAADRAAAEAAFDDAIADGRLELECRIHRAGDGVVRWITLQGRTYYDRAGQPAGMVGCIADVTERRHASERLRQTERLEAVGQLTGGVAHDFNNLLTVILGALDIITAQAANPAKVERMAKSAFAAGSRGRELTEKLLAFSRRQVVEPETVNPNRLIGEFEFLVRRAVGEAIAVDLDLDPRLDPVRLDTNQFQAAILNLAANARDAMPGEGRLSIETRSVTLTAHDAAGIVDAQPGRYARIAIRDTGTGMDPATAAKAFEPFFTTKEVGKGTGLGLSQVYGFARQSGGFCRIRTAAGEGCAIELYLPRSSDSSVAAPAHAPAMTVPIGRAADGEVVLVVEDQEDVRDMAAETLRSLGYNVLTAPDARVALDILRGPSRVDILFSDVVMPGGMNGSQLAVEAQRLRDGLRILLTSGYTAIATAGTRELPAGIPLLRKPYLKHDLASKLRLLVSA